MNSKTIVLFDMDGTLTPARKKIDTETVRAVKELTRHAHVGIVTGSDLNYLLEQCVELWRPIGSCNPNDITLLPCNGTKKLSWKSKKFTMDNCNDMKEKLGLEKYTMLIEKLVSAQSYYIGYTKPECPLTGTFISYRGSLLNYCPIGRDADFNTRKKFIKLDETNLIRARLLDKLNQELSKYSEDFEMRLGGQTSIDIFPKGWDKSFALQYFEGMNVYFVGDKCKPGENDFDIYKEIMPSNRFKTTGPEETRGIISKIIEKIKGEE